MKRIALMLGVAMVLAAPTAALASHTEGPPECETVVVEEAWTEVIPGTPSQHYSYVGGPIEGTPAPPPAEGWQANTEQEPPGHLNSTSAPDGSAYSGTGLHYASHGNSGLADWFYFDPGTPDTVIEHPEVTEEECHEAEPTDPPDPSETPDPICKSCDPGDQWSPDWEGDNSVDVGETPRENLAQTGGDVTGALIGFGVALAAGLSALAIARRRMS